jgi:5-oxoprolinase (ATP-hydrolysing)
MLEFEHNWITETEPEHDGLDPLRVATGADVEPSGLLRIAADTGGTFTDLVLTDEYGVLLATHKLLSTPDDPSRAVLEGCREILAMAGRTGEAYELIHGTTVATNAMLTRSGARVGLIVNKGMEGLLSIGRQNRPELYALHPRRGEALVDANDTYGLEGKEADWAIQLGQLFGISSQKTAALPVLDWAICITGPEAGQEQEISRLMQDSDLLPTVLKNQYRDNSIINCLGLDYVAAALHETAEIHTSMDIAPDALEYERCCTTVANAMVARLMKKYLTKLEQGEQQKLSIMASDGGLVPVSVVSEKPVLTMLSGPAGGALGALQAGYDCSMYKLISFDMGGTSTDVALLDSSLPLTRTMDLDGIPLRLPHIDIYTVGAGGGSIAWIDSGGALKVGPQSAGADPGPACYGRQQADAPLATVTDAHVVLGNLPEGVLLAGRMELDREASTRVVSHLATQLGLTTQDCAEGILRIADQNMANAIRAVSSQRGHDPRDYTLVPFGGAGGLHAVRLAELLGMKRILLPASPGLLSAVGMLAAPMRFSRSMRVEMALKDLTIDKHGLDELHVAAAELSELLNADCRAAGDDPYNFNISRTTLDMRYVGQDHELPVDWNNLQWQEDFHRLHEQRYGHCHRDAELEVVALHMSCDRLDGTRMESEEYLRDHGNVDKMGTIVLRSRISPDEDLCGPRIITEQSATTVLPVGWSVRLIDNGHLVIMKDEIEDCAQASYAPPDCAATSAKAGAPAQHEDCAVVTPCVISPPSPTPVPGNPIHGPRSLLHSSPVPGPRSLPTDPIELEIFRQLFASVAEEMGNSLMRTAHSPNINQRRDFSCAVFNENAVMIAQAAHIPVHLGSMGTAVQAVLAKFPLATMAADSHYIVNDPFSGGTHLPDITLVSPVVPPGEKQPRFLVASRAHHSDVGGISPGSLPLSSHIDEEGIRIEPGLFDEAMILRICAASRTPNERRGDLNAQLASQHTGQRRMQELCSAYGWQHVSAMATQLMDYSAGMMREVVAAIPDGTYEALDYMDGDGLDALDVAIRVKLTICGDTLSADFTESDDQVPGSINAVRAITLSALGYVMRLLAPDELPQNEGAMQPLTLFTRPGSIVDALYPAAVAAGNVETSQRITDVLMQALAIALPERMPACSQGTMNNVLIGGTDPRNGQRFSYYETIGGGCGAGPDGPGESAMHSHMTNTLNTPIETIARRYPFRVTEYRETNGCGGSGQFFGGEGIVRRYEFDAPCTVTLITERRRHSVPGLQGGQPGKFGANTHILADGSRIPLPGKCSIEVQAGDSIEIITPGGGGWGSPE